MFRLSNRRGASSTGAVVGIVVVAALAVGVWYLVSKPFQTRLDENLRQATDWTSENIQKDPVGYLTYALAEVSKTEDKLQASELSLKTKKNGADRALEKHAADKSQYEKLLGEFKDAYKTASSSNKWPVSVRNINFEENALKRKIVETNDEIKNTAGLVETYTKTNNVIESKLSEVTEKLTDLTKLKNKLSTDLEIAKVNKSVAGIDSINDQLNAIRDTTSALVKTAEEGTSVKDMIKPSGSARIDDEFSKIMGK